jgi:RimJ/RimL family protein N-acetyltransferase
MYGKPWELADAERLAPAYATDTSLERDGDCLTLAAERRDDGLVIGELTLWLRSVVHRQGEVGFAFRRDVQRQGYGSEALVAMLGIAFDRVNMHRVYGRTDTRNVASGALMERIGMRHEGDLRHEEWFKGEWADTGVYGMLEDEWRSSKGGKG